MRKTIVPAQITTVEDKIAGNLSVLQLLLLLSPVFAGTVVYALTPPTMHMVLYKEVLIGSSALCLSTLAIRIRGRIILHWITLTLRYNLRPRFYVANKNDLYLRSIFEEKTTARSDVLIPAQESVHKEKPPAQISFQEQITIESLLTNPKVNTRFTFPKKGGIHVSLAQIN